MGNVPTIKRIQAMATWVAILLLTFNAPDRHAHSIAESSLAAHDYYQNVETVDQKGCGKRAHLHAAIARQRDTCLACLNASRSKSAASVPVVLGGALTPGMGGLSSCQPGSIVQSQMNLPEGRGPPLT